ncbi:hypothetical protein [Runella sp.]|uniref:hypothetical protein n=1 Tax=Runella sp. TaxID=1960881 RepID=UPI003D0E6A74
MKTKTSKSATRSELANRYGVSIETMKKWLEKIPGLSLNPTDRVLTPKQVAAIIEHLGEP